MVGMVQDTVVQIGRCQEELHEEVDKTLEDPANNDKFEDPEGKNHFRFDHTGVRQKTMQFLILNST